MRFGPLEILFVKLANLAILGGYIAQFGHFFKFDFFSINVVPKLTSVPNFLWNDPLELLLLRLPVLGTFWPNFVQFGQYQQIWVMQFQCRAKIDRCAKFHAKRPSRAPVINKFSYKKRWERTFPSLQGRKKHQTFVDLVLERFPYGMHNETDLDPWSVTVGTHSREFYNFWFIYISLTSKSPCNYTELFWRLIAMQCYLLWTRKRESNVSWSCQLEPKLTFAVILIMADEKVVS